MDRLYTRIAWVLIAGVFLVCLTDGLAHAAAGYQARACGFDNDKDGVYGEADDGDAGSISECDYCDGTTTDPDDDGNAEDLIYVDCEAGNNATGDGTPGTPYRSIEYALSQANGTGEEDIICVRGTCGTYNGGLTPGSPQMTVAMDGGATIITRNANIGAGAGNSEQFNYEYADDPAMIVAWDTDNDGEYPPYDTDQAKPFVIDLCDTAGQFDTCTSSSGRTLFDLSQADRFEFAHATIRNTAAVAQGSTLTGTAYVFAWQGNNTPDHQRIHDVYLARNLINAQSNNAHRNFFFDLSGHADYIAIENVDMWQNGAWQLRGWGGTNTTRGTYLRWKNVSVRDPDETTSGQTAGVKWWIWNNVEVIDNLFDYTGTTLSDTVQASFLSRDCNNTYVRGNTYKNVDIPFSASVLEQDGSPTGVDTVVFDRNYAYWTEYRDKTIVGARVFSHYTNGVERSECSGTCLPAGVDKCDDAAASSPGDNSDCDCSRAAIRLKNVSITNNVIDFTGNPYADAGVIYKNGDNCDDGVDADFGPVTIANNTIKNFNPTPSNTATAPRAAIMIGRNVSMDQDFDWKYVKGDISIYNNLITGLNGDVAILNGKRGSSGCGPTATNPTCTNAASGIAGSYASGADWMVDFNAISGSNIQYVRYEDCAVDGDCAGTGDCQAGDMCVYSTLAAWKAATGEDDNTTGCAPAFDADGYHLTSGDSCARNLGYNTQCTAYDIDGQARPSATTCDIGADEVMASQPGTIEIAAATYSATEGGTGVTVSVTRTGGSAGAASVDYAVLPVSAGYGATCDGSATKDYIDTRCDAQAEVCATEWADGNADTKTFTIPICNDSKIESDEVATIQLSDPYGASLGAHSWASLVITDDEESVGHSPYVSIIDDIVSACVSTSSTTLTVPAVAVTANSQPDRVLVVSVVAEDDYKIATPNDPDCDLTLGGASVAWGASQLTHAASTVAHATALDYSTCAAVFYLADPPAGTRDVVITFPAAVLRARATATVIYGADQDGPVRTVVAGAAMPTGSSISTGINTPAPDVLILDVLGLGNRQGAGNLTSGGGQTERSDVSCAQYGPHLATSTREVPTPVTTGMAWSWLPDGTSPQAYAHVLVAWQAVQPPVHITTTTVTSTTFPQQQAPTQGWTCVGPCVPVQ